MVCVAIETNLQNFHYVRIVEYFDAFQCLNKRNFQQEIIPWNNFIPCLVSVATGRESTFDILGQPSDRRIACE